jgi:hypothetical protein
MSGQTKFGTGWNRSDVDAVDRYQPVRCVDDGRPHACSPHSAPVVTAREPTNNSVTRGFAELDTIRSGPCQHCFVARVCERVTSFFVCNDSAHIMRKAELLKDLDSVAYPNDEWSTDRGQIIAKRDETAAHKVPMRWMGIITPLYRWLRNIERDDGPPMLSRSNEWSVVADPEVSFEPDDRRVRSAHKRKR